MKFNPLLKLQLAAWGTESPPIKKEPEPSPPKFPYETRGKVVGGEILWKPVDKQAALLLSKPPWWAYAPHVPTEKPTPNKLKNMKEESHFSKPPRISENAAGISVPMINSEAEEGVIISKQFIKATQTTLDRDNQLLNNALDARAAMDVMSDSWKKTWFDFQHDSSHRLAEMRSTRFAFDTEIRQLMSSMREVRQFFLDKDYEKERDRLKEFVELCERLKALKESGFLDQIADTLLKLG